MLGIAAYSGFIAYLELEYWKLSTSSNIKNIPLMHNLLGFAISMLLVFRTNTAMTAGGKAGNYGEVL